MINIPNLKKNRSHKPIRTILFRTYETATMPSTTKYNDRYLTFDIHHSRNPCDNRNLPLTLEKSEVKIEVIKPREYYDEAARSFSHSNDPDTEKREKIGKAHRSNVLR